jgi:hypothetical protein
MQKTEINYDFIMGNSSTSPRAIDSAANAMGLNTETGERASMEKERDTLWALEKEPTSSVPTVMTLMSQNLDR